jgi:putative peptidoglycan lipid II flippase
MAVVTVLYPILAQEVNKPNFGKLKEMIIKSVNVIILICIPATVGLIVLAKPIVKLAFERGEFDGIATVMTSGALIFYAVGIVGVALRMIFDRVYFSMQDTKTPMVNGIIAVIINIVLNLILIRYMQHKGLALATSISMTIASGLLLYGLRKKLGAFGFMQSVICGIKAGIAAIVMGVAVFFIYSWSSVFFGIGTLNEIFALFTAVGVGVIIYAVLIYLLKVDEVKWLLSIIRR